MLDARGHFLSSSHKQALGQKMVIKGSLYHNADYGCENGVPGETAHFSFRYQNQNVAECIQHSVGICTPPKWQNLDK